jgi:DNA-binding MarR family transcriptional regulator
MAIMASAATLSVCTCTRLRKAARRVSQIYDRSLAAVGLTVTQYGLLAHLARYDGIGVGALAEKLIMDPTTVTRNLGPLERQGLVVLKADVSDRRARTLHLTAGGRKALERARPAWARAQRDIEAAYGAGELKALHAMLERVLARVCT